MRQQKSARVPLPCFHKIIETHIIRIRNGTWHSGNDNALFLNQVPEKLSKNCVLLTILASYPGLKSSGSIFFRLPIMCRYWKKQTTYRGKNPLRRNPFSKAPALFPLSIKDDSYNEQGKSLLAGQVRDNYRYSLDLLHSNKPAERQ